MRASTAPFCISSIRRILATSVHEVMALDRLTSQPGSVCFDLPLSSLQRARPHETSRYIRYLGGGCSSCKLGCVSGGLDRQVRLAASFCISAVTLLATCSAMGPLRFPAILANLLVHSALDREESQKNQPARKCIHNACDFGSFKPAAASSVQQLQDKLPVQHRQSQKRIRNFHTASATEDRQDRGGKWAQDETVSRRRNRFGACTDESLGSMAPLAYGRQPCIRGIPPAAIIPGSSSCRSSSTAAILNRVLAESSDAF